MPPQHLDIGLDLEAHVNRLGQASWADVPHLQTGNVWTSEEYDDLLGKHYAGEDWRNGVLNSSYYRSYDEWRGEGTCDGAWRHLLLFSPGPRWQVWRWRLFLSVAWWLPGGIIQGAVYPLFFFRRVLTWSAIVMSAFELGWFARWFVYGQT